MTSCTKQSAAQIISTVIQNAPGNILVLLSGGSSAEIGVFALKNLTSDKQQHVTVALADERYVAYGSIDSNATLLKSLQVTNYCQTFIEVLPPNTESLESTATQYQAVIQQQLNQADTVIAVFGVGEDNHTAGILPGSPALNAKTIIDSYSSNPYMRITITPPVFLQIDAAFVYAQGESKLAAAESIKQQYDIATHPSQLVKQAKLWQVLFNKETI